MQWIKKQPKALKMKMRLDEIATTSFSVNCMDDGTVHMMQNIDPFIITLSAPHIHMNVAHINARVSYYIDKSWMYIVNLNLELRSINSKTKKNYSKIEMKMIFSYLSVIVIVN